LARVRPFNAEIRGTDPFMAAILSEPPTRPAGPPARERVERPLRALAERMLIIGLDGATFDVLDPLMAAGRMPNRSGSSSAGWLES
jgi:hypothetical protein